jgi:hypothetical protein
MGHWSAILCAAAAVLAGCAIARAQDAPPVAATVERGITGEVQFIYDGPTLSATPQQDLDAPMLLRLEPDPGDATRYTARFIGSVEGDYDLRTLIQLRDGSPARDLDPLVVRVVSNLPAGLGTDLRDAADIDVKLQGGYRTRAIAVVAAWLAVPVVVITRRLLRPKRVVEVEAEPAPPTLADQLRPLVIAAASRELSVAEQGRLELLLYHYWRERLSLEGMEAAEAIVRIRHDAASGELLGAVEGWLHRPEQEAHDADRLSALLAPYREAPAVAEIELGVAERETAVAS